MFQGFQIYFTFSYFQKRLNIFRFIIVIILCVGEKGQIEPNTCRYVREREREHQARAFFYFQYFFWFFLGFWSCSIAAFSVVGYSLSHSFTRFLLFYLPFVSFFLLPFYSWLNKPIFYNSACKKIKAGEF